MDCNCHEVLGGEADDAGVDTDRHVDFFGSTSIESSGVGSDVELVVDDVSSIIGAFAIVVREQVRIVSKERIDVKINVT